MIDGPGAPPKPPRRARYRGKNPRRFAEKYKERAPEKYPGVAEHVRGGGKTPAGTHVPVLLAETLAALAPAPGEVALDATLGFGGHAAALLPALLPGGRLLGLDVDPIELPKTEARLRAAGFGPDVFTAVKRNFAGIPALLERMGLEGVDVLLADLGVSSMQLDDPARGFTFKEEGPLDLRLDPTRGRPAADLLARLTEARLAALLSENADEPHADLLARALVTARVTGPIATTTRAAAVVREALAALPPRVRDEEGDAPIRRVLQALRMEVNEERTALAALLAALPGVLRPGGRVALISFHSGEDRLVKKAFQQGLRAGLFSRVAPDPVRASAEERRANPRSSPAKLRWALRA